MMKTSLAGALSLACPFERLPTPVFRSPAAGPCPGAPFGVAVAARRAS